MEEVTLIKVIAGDLNNKSNFIETSITNLTQHGPGVASLPDAEKFQFSFQAFSGDDLIGEAGNVCKLMIMILCRV